MMLAHESEARPVYGTWFCDCHGCQVQARALAAADPGASIVVKRSYGRDVLTASQWARLVVKHGVGAADVLCVEPGDYVREVFVGAPRHEGVS